MSNDAVAKLLEQGQRSGLFVSAEAQEAIAQATPDPTLTAEKLSAQLVEKKVITAYQAEQLLAGRAEECVIAGRYRILDELGAGGMGTVYKAQDTKLDRLVAIKVLPPHLVSDPGAVARFQREAKALAKVSHPAIIQAHDAGEDRGRHFLVMEYVEGINLAGLLKERGRIPPTLAADYVHQAALGLQHAHDRGLVHRDLKPSNLILAAGRHIKILDLGLARFLQDQLGDAGLTREGTGLGTPDYMAPEQFGDARHVDHRADIYALGCTLYHLVSGAVPFPGSSLSEKAQAHETQEPEPLEALCPDVTAGLVLVVQRMMAKKPGDRFQSAAELAEALAPYLGGSSASLPQLKKTTTWEGSQLSFTLARRPSRRRRTTAVVLGAAALAALLTVGSFLLPGLLRARSTSPSNDQPDPSTTSPTVTAEPQEPADPNVLTVSQDPKDGGQFRTINEALEKVKPGQTVRVLDDGVYQESSTVRTRAITLEAPRRATIEVAKPGANGIRLIDAPGVNIRGFRFRAKAHPTYLVAVFGASNSVVIDDLQMEGSEADLYVGIDLEGVTISKQDPPVVVQNCVFHRAEAGILVAGAHRSGGSEASKRVPWPCGRIVIRNNTFISPKHAVYLVGSVHEIQVVANRVSNTTSSAFQIEELLEGASDILIANNAFYQCAHAFRYWDDKDNPVKGRGIEVRNNLTLGKTVGADMIAIDSGGHVSNYRGFGDGAALAAVWRFDHNWRELSVSRAGLPGMIPPSRLDVRRDEIPVVSCDPAHPDFLRPAKDSPLATEGAGKTDPRLPTYVGAVPPEGVSPWDWDRTWRMPKDAQLLTVSKDAKDGGQFRTINDALKDAKPWATIRVLDNAEYAEPVVLDDSSKHEGIVLESRGSAVIVVGQSPQGLAIKGVPRVKVRHLRFRKATQSDSHYCVSISGACPGVSLEHLNIEGDFHGVLILGTATLEEPIEVRNCDISLGRIALAMAGQPGVTAQAVRAICVRDNRMWGNWKGIHIEGTVADAQVTGNIAWGSTMAGLHMERLTSQTERILFASNTVFDSPSAFRLWEAVESPSVIGPNQVELRNNLLFDALSGDISCFVARSDLASGSPERMQVVAERWRFGQNWRDCAGAYPMPLAPNDRRLESVNLLSRDPSHPDYLRPSADSPLAQEGAGKEDASLPIYVGAVPPKGVQPWDWGKTWRWRMRTNATTASKPSSAATATGDKGESQK